MKESFEKPRVTIEASEAPTQEHIAALRKSFEDAHVTLETEGREKAKVILTQLYKTLEKMNKWDRTGEYKPWGWNKDGYLSEEEFNDLDLGRKKLSNAIGIMTTSDVIRHDLNKI